MFLYFQVSLEFPGEKSANEKTIKNFLLYYKYFQCLKYTMPVKYMQNVKNIKTVWHFITKHIFIKSYSCNKLRKIMKIKKDQVPSQGATVNKLYKVV